MEFKKVQIDQQQIETIRFLNVKKYRYESLKNEKENQFTDISYVKNSIKEKTSNKNIIDYAFTGKRLEEFEFQEDKFKFLDNEFTYFQESQLFDEDETIKKKSVKTNNSKNVNNNQQGINKNNHQNIFKRNLPNSNQEVFQEDVERIFENRKLINDYSDYKYIIYEYLLKRNYVLEKYLASGGEADVFEGYFLNQQGYKEQYVFKLYFDVTDQKFQEEINLMKSFENPINIIKIKDQMKVQDVFILVLEKCQYSLLDQLNMFIKKEKIFSIDILLQIIFDLVDGLIQLRIYNILHLDIKPGNILVAADGSYSYSDFGCSFRKKKNQELTQIEGYTENYASPEQIQRNINSIDFKSDIYSLGKTILKVINIFKQTNQNNEERINSLIKVFEKIVNDSMVQYEKQNRLECQDLYEIFFEQICIQEHCQFFQMQLKKIQKIIELLPYDKNKDIPYFQRLNLFYNLKGLYLVQNTFSLNLQDTSMWLYKVGQCYKKLGEFDNALKHLNKSMEIQRQIQPTNYTSLMITIQNEIGLCYKDIGDTKTALKYLLESLEFLKQTFSGNNHYIAELLNNVGLCYMDIGEHQNAQKYLQNSMEMRGEMFQGNHQSLAESLNNLGQCLSLAGDKKNALNHLIASLEMGKQIYQGNHPEIALSLNRIGSCYYDFGDIKNAIIYYVESMKMKKQIYQDNHPEIAYSLNNLGTILLKLGQYKDTQKYLFESLEMSKQIFFGNHPFIATVLDNIGEYYREIGEYENSLKFYLESFDMKKQIFKGNNPDIAISLNNIGQIYKCLGKFLIAQKYLVDSLDMSRQVYKQNHPLIVESLKNLGLCYYELRDFQIALQYLLESLEIQKQICEGNSFIYSKLLYNVAACYKDLGNKQCYNQYLGYYQEKIEQLLED